MSTLKIVIKKEFFDQIKSGEKKIEYREVKPSKKGNTYHIAIGKIFRKVNL